MEHDARSGQPSQEPTSRPEYAAGASTLTEVTTALEQDGFTAQMLVRDEGRIACRHCGAESASDRFTVAGVRRTEGASDPDDMVVVAAITCPQCGAGGTLVLPYGPRASADEAVVLRQLEGEG